MRIPKALACEVAGLLVLGALAAVATHGFVAVRVDGGSMRPALEVGDIVLVQRTTAIAPGDIALFRLAGDTQSTLHRAMGVSGGGIATRGDANPIGDRRSVPHPSVLGRVRWVLPFGVLRERLRGRSCDTVPSQSQSARL